eukprot:TRINITY_DN39222_c0_g1_i1.p1 TRINITY_DN39222_c0_g1~~TRINITY_DN39222_c0_g1_i1.p1  ORF type:complete len:167 (+),score=23.11 TRINITY_DN39222_c0_g1_i1:190-690(+)
MIEAVIILNKHGQPRLTKFYGDVKRGDGHNLIRVVYSAVSGRAEGVCSVLEDEDAFGKGIRLVYRCFATLYFVFLIDGLESELAVLDLIHAFVETLDEYFEKVSEKDLTFNFAKVHQILDEMVMGGQVLETSSANVLAAVRAMNTMERQPEPAATLLKERRGHHVG